MHLVIVTSILCCLELYFLKSLQKIKHVIQVYQFSTSSICHAEGKRQSLALSHSLLGKYKEMAQPYSVSKGQST